MAEWFVGPILEKLIDTCSEYLQDQVRWQTGMKEELERLRENHPKIQAVVSAACQAQIIDQNLALNKWIWQLRDAIDEADDVLDDFEYTKHEEELAKKLKEIKKCSVGSLLFGIAQKFRRVDEPALKIDPNLARLEEVVHKIDNVSAECAMVVWGRQLFCNTPMKMQRRQNSILKCGFAFPTPLMSKKSLQIC